MSPSDSEDDRSDPLTPISSLGIDGELFHGDVSERYASWPTPTVIVSDGAYGTGGFPGDPSSPSELAEWYAPHVRAWSEAATLGTTLWIWNTELGWAKLHPLIEESGWAYRGCNTWDKGFSHIAGNSNTETMRKFPQVTEVCVQYVRDRVELADGSKPLREWMRDEWDRAGLSLSEADAACDVTDAASRKYFGTDEQWYCPPPKMFDRLAEYANEHGDPGGRPYFSPPAQGGGEDTDDVGRLGTNRATFDLQPGVTNVWHVPQLSGDERREFDGEALHLNQKPMELMERIIRASSAPEDVVWDPFSGTGTAAVAAKRLGRVPFAAEKVSRYHSVARNRIADAAVSSAEATTEQSSLTKNW